MLLLGEIQLEKSGRILQMDLCLGGRAGVGY